MKTYLDCYPCFLKQVIKAGRMSDASDETLKRMLDRLGEMLKDIPLDSTPPETGDLIYGLVREYSGNSDPFKKIKQQNIREALALIPYLSQKVEHSDDPLLTAIRIAIAGNIMDLAVDNEYKLEEDLDYILCQDFRIFHYEEFKNSLRNAGSVLYLGDNAGESVFDRILVEELKKPVVYVVRDRPVINDVTIEDAIASGLDEVAEIISNGSSAPGTVLRSCSPEFLHRFGEADMIISKGQGNYESLSETGRPVFYLLKAKCKVIASDLGVRLNDIVLMHSASSRL